MVKVSPSALKFAFGVTDRLEYALLIADPATLPALAAVVTVAVGVVKE